MAEQKMISEKEAVMRERAAFRLGARTYACAECREMMERDNGPAAAVRYPLPKVTRPRVVADPHGEFHQHWRVCNGRIEWVNGDPRCGGWQRFIPEAMSPLVTEPTSIMHVTNERIAMWADLLANPTEEVEDV